MVKFYLKKNVNHEYFNFALSLEITFMLIKYSYD